MRLCRLGGAQRFGAHPIEVLREVRTDRRGPHRSSVPERALAAEQALRFATPGCATADAREEIKGALPVATIRVIGPPARERRREGVGAMASWRPSTSTTDSAIAVSSVHRHGRFIEISRFAARRAASPGGETSSSGPRGSPGSDKVRRRTRA
jgi:hypothetical protein